LLGLNNSNTCAYCIPEFQRKNMKDLRIVEKNYTMHMAVIFFYEIFGRCGNDV
jgi:hypothetical protein